MAYTVLFRDAASRALISSSKLNYAVTEFDLTYYGTGITDDIDTISISGAPAAFSLTKVEFFNEGAWEEKTTDTYWRDSDSTVSAVWDTDHWDSVASGPTFRILIYDQYWTGGYRPTKVRFTVTGLPAEASTDWGATMGKTIQFRRGLVANIPNLAIGEPGWATDTNALYVGDGVGSPVLIGNETSSFMAGLLDDDDLATALATLGLDTSLATFALPDSTTISAFGKTIVDDANAAAVIATLELDADLATFSLPASTTISAFGKTVIDDTSAAAVRTTIGAQADLTIYMVDGYGAAGDGSTDDTTDIQSALTAGAGAIVYFTPGKTYKITANLSVPANTVVWAYGATVTCATSHFNAFDFVNGGYMLGMTLTGAGNAAYDADGIAIQCVGTNNDPAAPTFVNAPVIRDCTISEWGSYGVYFQYTNRGIVENNKITGIGYAGVAGLSCNDLMVKNNTVDEVSPGTVGGDAYGIFIDRADGTSETEEPRSYRCVIEGNNVLHVQAGSGNNGQGIDTHGGVDFRIIGNNVEHCEAGIFITASSISGTQALAPKRCVVANNTINWTGDGFGIGYGIMVNGANDAGTPVEYAQGIIITGNTINGYGISNDDTAGAIVLQFTKDCVVSGNSIYRPTCNGICLNVYNYGVNVSGNVIIDPHDDDYATPSCIGVVGSYNSGFIGGNTCRYESDAHDTYVNIYSVMTKGSLSGLDLDIYHNSYAGAAVGHNAYNKGTSSGVRDT